MQSVHYNKPILQCTMPILHTIISTPHQALLCSAKSVWSVSWVPSPLAAVAAPQQVYLVEVFLAGLITFWSPFPTVSVLRIFHWMCVCNWEQTLRGLWPLRVSTVMSALAVCGRWGNVRQSRMSGRTHTLSLYRFVLFPIQYLLLSPIVSVDPQQVNLWCILSCFIKKEKKQRLRKRKRRVDYYITIDSCLERASCQIKDNYVWLLWGCKSAPVRIFVFHILRCNTRYYSTMHKWD